MKRFLIFIIILIMAVSSFAQQRKIRYQDLDPRLQDMLGLGTGDMVLVADDTTALKAASGDDGDYAYLVELSSGSGTGGGFFVQVDSAYSEGGINGGYAYNNATTGKQWVRINFLENKTLYSDWAGSLENAINGLRAGYKLYVNSGSYDLSGDPTISIDVDSIEIIFDVDAVITGDSTATKYLFTINGDTSGTVDLGEDITAPNDTIIVSDGSGFSAEDYIFIYDTTTTQEFLSGRFETNKVKSVSSDTLFLYYPTSETYEVDSAAIVAVLDPIENVKISGGRFVSNYDKDSNNTNRVYVFDIDFTWGVTLENMQIDSTAAICYAEYYNRFLTIRNCKFNGGREATFIYRSRNTQIENCEVRSTDLRCIQLSRNSDDSRIYNNNIWIDDGDVSGIGTQRSKRVKIFGNTIIGKEMNYGIVANVYCDGNMIVKNHIVGNDDYGIAVVESNDCLVDGNDISQGGFSGIHLDATGHTTVVNNTIHDLENIIAAGGIIATGGTDSSRTYDDRYGNIIANNRIEDIGGYGIKVSQTFGQDSMRLYFTKVYGNYIDGCDRGIYVGEMANFTELRNNTIKNAVSYEVTNFDSTTTGDDFLVTEWLSTAHGDTLITGYFNRDIYITSISYLVEEDVTGDTLKDQIIPINEYTYFSVGRDSITHIASQFVASDGYDLDKFSAYLRGQGTPTQELVGKVYNNSSDAPTTMIANAYSDTIDASTFTTNPAWVNFTFATAPSITQADTYWCVIEVDDSDGGANFVQWKGDDTSYVYHVMYYDEDDDSWHNYSVAGDTGAVYLRTYARDASFTQFVYNVGEVDQYNNYSYAEFLTDTVAAPVNASTREITTTTSYVYKTVDAGNGIVISTDGGGYTGKIRLRIDYIIL